jgi:NADH-quinone oxidoreductase subunit A
MQTTTLWPLVVYAGAVTVLVTSMLALSYVLGQRHQGTATGEPYESGIVSTGSARVRLSAEFYLVAMFFVIFDLEAVFIVAWAIAFRELGWVGYIEVVVFIGILLTPWCTSGGRVRWIGGPWSAQCRHVAKQDGGRRCDGGSANRCMQPRRT